MNLFSLVLMSLTISTAVVTGAQADDPNAAFQPDPKEVKEGPAAPGVHEDQDTGWPTGPDPLTKAGTIEAICDSAQRSFINQARISKEKAIAKEGGFLNKDIVYQASKAIVESNETGLSALARYKKMTGHEFTDKQLKTECDFFKE